MSKANFNSNWAARGFKKTGSDNEKTSEITSVESSVKFPPFSRPKPSEGRKPHGEPRGQKRKAENDHNSNVRPKVEKKEKPSKSNEVKPSVVQEGSSNENVGGKSATPQKAKKAKAGKSYILFVGNLNYETTKEDLTSYFGGVEAVKSVRIPCSKSDNKPRGFAYVELQNFVAYEKALSLHHTFLQKRRINVECTLAGSKNSKPRMSIIKDKTLKLRYLGLEGKLHTADSVKKKASNSVHKRNNK